MWRIKHIHYEKGTDIYILLCVIQYNDNYNLAISKLITSNTNIHFEK